MPGWAPPPKMLNSGGLAARWDGGTPSPSLHPPSPPPPEQRMGEREGQGPCQSHPHSQHPGWGGWGRAEMPSPPPPKKKPTNQPKKVNHEEMPKGLDWGGGQVGAGPWLRGGRSVLGLFTSFAAVFSGALGCP